MPVIRFDTAAYNANQAAFRAASQEHAGGHSVQKAAGTGSADVATINATSAKYREGVERFKEAMRSMQINDPGGRYSRLQADLQSAVRKIAAQPRIAKAAQSNLLSRARVSTML